MVHTWQLQEAKNRFSQVVEDALHQGPQWVTRHGEPAVVVLSIKEYKKLIKPKSSLLDFFQKSPLAKGGLDLERRDELPREVDL